MNSYVEYDEHTPLLVRNNPSEDNFKNNDVEAGPRGNNSSWIGPDGLLIRIIALILMSIIGFGAFFCFDNPGALQSELKEALNITTSEFSSLYSWYSWPNVILPVIGGYLIDSVFGVRLGTIIFAAFICLGQLLLGLGASQNWFWFMKMARFLFGVGGESLNMALNTYTVTWFRDKELNMVFGFQLSISRVGSTVNFLVMEPLYDRVREHLEDYSALGCVFMIAASFTVLSFICSLGLAFLDKRRENGVSQENQHLQVEQKIQLSDIKDFPVTFWLLCLSTLAYYGSIFPFISLAQGLFKDVYGFDGETSNFIVGLVYLISALASPILGWMLDKTHRNLRWMSGSILVSVLSHCLMAWTTVSPYLPVITMGLSYSVLASALWSLPAIIVSQHQLGTAFGIMQALQNLGTALITIGAGYIVDMYGYYWLELFFIFWLLVSLSSSLVIWSIDSRTHGILNMSTSQWSQMVDESEVQEKMVSNVSDGSFSRGL